MSKEDMSYDDWYDELVRLSHKLEPYYCIDKIKSYSVYIWYEDDNVFDIQENGIIMYEKNDIPSWAFPIITEIQKWLSIIPQWKVEE